MQYDLLPNEMANFNVRQLLINKFINTIKYKLKVQMYSTDRMKSFRIDTLKNFKFSLERPTIESFSIIT